jgi:cystinosin
MQVIENAQRKSVAGLSADYLVYSLLGYTAYTAYTTALHFNPGVQAAYMAAHAGALPDVQLTDVLFAGHALLVTMYTLYQCVLYGGNSSSSSSSSGPLLQTSKVANMTTAAVFAAVVAYSGHIGSTCGPDDCDAWLPMLYLLGFIKVGCRGFAGGSQGDVCRTPCVSSCSNMAVCCASG